MPDPSTYLAFLGAVLTYQLSGVGPDMTLVISHGISQGRRIAIATAFGCVAAGIIQIPALAMGFAAVVNSSPMLYGTMQIAGAAYLFYLGLRLILADSGRTTSNTQQNDPAISLIGAFRQGMICNLTNPTALSFMLAILPQFVQPSAGTPAWQFVILGSTMKLTGLFILVATATASGSFSSYLSRNRRFRLWQQRISGCLMIAFGIKLLFSFGAPSFSGRE